MEPVELSFIVLGLVEVFAGVLLLTSAAPILVKRLGKSKFLTRRWGPVLPVSLAYPLATPVRTAVVMGMFSITVFSVIVLGGYAEQFDNYTSSFVEDAEGDYELLLTGMAIWVVKFQVRDTKLDRFLANNQNTPKKLCIVVCQCKKSVLLTFVDSYNFKTLYFLKMM